MLRRTLALLITVLCLAAVSYGSFPRPLADVPIMLPGGKTMHLSQYKGKAMVVLILLTTCEHCGMSAEMLTGLQKSYSKDLQVVAVAVNPEAAQESARFSLSHHLNYPLGYMTNEDSIMKLGDFKRTDHPNSPMYLFVTREGEVKWQYNGEDKVFFLKEDQNVQTLVQSLLKK